MKKALSLLTLFFLYSCTNAVFNETIKDFPDGHWEKANPVTFDFEVKDTVTADVTLKFAHIHSPGYNLLPLDVKIQGPYDFEENFETILELEESECAGDICDIRQTVATGINFKQGNYKITVKHNFNRQVLPNVLAVGVVVE